MEDGSGVENDGVANWLGSGHTTDAGSHHRSSPQFGVVFVTTTWLFERWHMNDIGDSLISKAFERLQKSKGKKL
jgi:hypothetical protein